MKYITSSIRFILVIAIVLFITNNSIAQSLTISNTSTTSSLCAADGTLTTNVSADLNGAALTGVYYSIESTVPGASRSETQNVDDPYNYKFIGLPAGSHKLVVKLILSTTQQIRQEKTIKIDGTYARPELFPYEYIPSLSTCDTTGAIFVRLMGGKEPLSLTISEYTGASPVDPVGRTYIYSKVVNTNTKDYFFFGLPSGKYKFRVQDDCGAVEYNTVTLNTMSLSSIISSSPNYNWFTNCRLRLQPYISGYTHPYSTAISNYYKNHKNITYIVTGGGYTSKARQFLEYDTIPELDTKNMTWQGSLAVYDPCGNLARTVTANVDNNSISSNVYPPANFIDCDHLRIYFGGQHIGSEYRVLQGGVVKKDWAPINFNYETFYPGVPYKDIYSTYYSVEIKNTCGGSYSKNVAVKRPLYYYPASGITYNCDVENTFNYYGKIYNDYDGVICLPAKYILKNTETNEEYICEVPERGTQFVKEKIPCGTYKITLEGADGWSYTDYSTYTYKRPIPYISYGNADYCNEGKGFFRLSNITSGARVEIESSPLGTSYYYDKTATNNTLDINPNNGETGIGGDYKLKVTDTCGTVYKIDYTFTNVYNITKFELTQAGENCDGLTINTNGEYTSPMNPGVTYKAYFKIISAPVGYIYPSINTLSGTPIVLKQAGKYVIGISVSSSYSQCHYREQIIEYDGVGVKVDLNKSLAYVCPGDPDTKGHIYVQAIRGLAPYVYYVSNEGDGGEQVIGNPAKYIATNDNGDFTAIDFLKGKTYDVTIQDACGSIVLQQYKVGDLREVRLAYAEKPTVCEGSTIQFKAMALPNPTYAWSKPGTYPTLWSTEQSPSIASATMADKGIFKVDITTSLCQSQTVTLDVSVEVQEVPTIIRSGGAADQFICSEDNVTDIVYTWGGSATDVSITGISSAYYTKNSVAKTITIKGKISSTSTYTIASIGGCSDISVSGTITVKTKPTVTLPIVALSNQAVCLGNSITTFTYSNAGSTTDISVAGLPNGVTGIYASNKLTVSGTPTTAGTYTFTVTASTTDPDNPCPVSQYTGTITVGTEDELILTSAIGTDNQTVCYSASGAITPIVYTWGGTATNVTVMGIPSSYYVKNVAAKTLTINRSAASPGLTSFTISTIGTCSPKTLNGSINMLALLDVPSISAQYVCSGQIPSITIPNTKLGATYKLYLNYGDVVPLDTQTSISEGSSIVLTASVSITAPQYYYIGVESAEGCVSANKSVYVNIWQLPTTPVLVSEPTCEGSGIIITVHGSSISQQYTVYDSPIYGSIVSGPISGNNYSLNIDCGAMKVASRTYYVEVTSANGCTQAGGRTPILVELKESLWNYPDIRIQVCKKPDREINIDKYIDNFGIQSHSLVMLPSMTPVAAPIQTSTLSVGETYSFEYELVNDCGVYKKRKMYLTVIDDKTFNIPSDTVVVCWENAVGMNINQIVGVEANGTWSWEPSNALVNKYVNYILPPLEFGGSVTFDGKGIYWDTNNLLTTEDYRGTTVKKIEFYYKTDPNGCLAGKQYKVVVLLSPSVIP